MLKETKIQLEKGLNKELTWNEFFNKIEIKIKDTETKKDGEK